ncbi:MAG: hypothetical protein EXX96DRAFT_567406 [Benjaminiella poitrasii]|nr:MAG: hypothetical protein EXX96DRAFT_567406 [Benjaminiella poitrasii]
MLLLFATFSITFIIYLFIYNIQKIRDASRKLNSIDPSKPIAQCYLETINMECSQWTWMPVFIRVYLVGMFETAYIVIHKRGLFKGSTTRLSNEKCVDDLIQSYKAKEDYPGLAVFTGGDSGIGFHICKGLLLAGFHLIIGTRSIESCHSVITELKKSTGSDKVCCLELDLSSFRSVKKFVKQVKLKAPKRDIRLLINNAGIMNIPYKMTEDNYESQCQINYLSPILLTELLLPWMNQSTGRVLFASSSTLYAINNLNTTFPYEKYKLDGLSHYAYSKSCISHLVKKLAETTPVKIFAYHPGTVRTKLFEHTTVFSLPIVSKIFDFIMLTPKEGSQTPLYLCLMEKVGKSGTYWANEHVQQTPPIFVNEKRDDIEGLWRDTMMKCGSKSQ